MPENESQKIHIQIPKDGNTFELFEEATSQPGAQRGVTGHPKSAAFGSDLHIDAPMSPKARRVTVQADEDGTLHLWLEED